MFILAIAAVQSLINDLSLSTNCIRSVCTTAMYIQLVVPSQSNQILSAPLHQFVAQIKEPYGSTDGADRYPGSYLSAPLLVILPPHLFVCFPAPCLGIRIV